MIPMQIQKKKIYDVCVIGSGAAGGFMVKELTAAGADTVLLEAGGRGRLEDLHIHDWAYDLPKRGFGLFKQASLYPDDIRNAIEFRGDRVVCRVANVVTEQSHSGEARVRP